MLLILWPLRWRRYTRWDQIPAVQWRRPDWRNGVGADRGALRYD